MKKTLLLTLFLIGIFTTANAQECGGTFTDPAGPAASYANNSDYIVTINPTNIGEVVTVTFTAFSTENNFDALYVFNGNSITAPQITSGNGAGNVPGGLAGGYWGTAIPGPFTSTSPDGSLTFRFRSDASGFRDGWIANVTCGPPPTCPKPTSISAMNATHNSVLINWAENGNATSWHVYAAPVGSPAPTATTTGFITATSNPFSFQGLISNTCYAVYVRSVCSVNDISDWSIAANFCTLIAPPVCGGNFVDDGGPTGNYVNNTNTNTVICPSIAGEVVTVTFTSFNTEANWDGLLVYNGNSTLAPQISSTNGVGNGPLTNLPGAFWGNQAANLPGPFTSTSTDGCLTFRFLSDGSGVAAGWTANITCGPPASCVRPTAPAVNSVNATTAVLNWTENNAATSWEVVVVPCGSAAPTATTVGTITTTVPYTATALIPSSCYSYYVRSICSPTDSSVWTGPFNFTTLTAPPACGGQFVDNGGPSGNYTNSSDVTNTICPTTQGELVTVTFTTFSTETNFDALYVFNGNSIAAPQIASTNLAGNVPGGLPGGFWGTVIPGPFTSSSSDGCLTFRFRSDGTQNRPGWTANVTCAPPPTCPAPNALSVTNVTTTSATLNWNGNSSATQWEVYIVPVGAPAPLPSTVGIPATTIPFLAPGLVSNTCYTFYVRGICSGTDISAWAGGFNFCTLIEPPVCGGQFVDNGGASANYANNSDNTYTICPTNPGEIVSVIFSSFDTEATYDALYVFDGNSISAPQIASANAAANVPGGLAGGYWGTSIPGPFVASSPDGCLTFRFRSDNTAVRAGWNATVLCTPDSDKIVLVAFVDANNNGTKDSGELLFPNGSFVYQQNNSGTDINGYSPTGQFALYDSNPANTYNFAYQLQASYAPYYSSGTTTYSNISIAVGSGTQFLYFPITSTQGYNDVVVSISPVSIPRPGFTYVNRITYKNLGTVATNGTITFAKPPQITTVVVSQAGIVNNVSGFTYAFTNLAPNEIRTFTVTMTVPDATLVNTLLTATVSITAPADDINLENNSGSNSQIVVNSYDPNDKMESRGKTIPFNQFSQDDYFYYTIRFQNDGTANAIDVQIQDLLNINKIDETTVLMVSASHNYTVKRINNQLIWDFKNILLTPSSLNPNGSRGYVQFKVKLKPGFAAGDIIPNAASIYFDNNPAIVTATFNSKFTIPLSVSEFSANSMVMHPNPANTTVQIDLINTNEQLSKVVFYDILGKAVKFVNTVATESMAVDVSDLSKGVYLVEITSDTNLKLTKKLVIQ